VYCKWTRTVSVLRHVVLYWVADVLQCPLVAAGARPGPVDHRHVLERTASVPFRQRTKSSHWFGVRVPSRVERSINGVRRAAVGVMAIMTTWSTGQPVNFRSENRIHWVQSFLHLNTVHGATLQYKGHASLRRPVGLAGRGSRERPKWDLYFYPFTRPAAHQEFDS
jgi:hypothetical protein